MTESRIPTAICTWNRTALLEQTLHEMEHLVVPPAVTWELLVVNNNCNDDTDDVIARFSGRLPIRRLFEPEPGLSNARNHAVREATGDYLLWTDDDVLVSPSWLVEYVAAFARHPAGVVFGGPVEPWFPHTPPEWPTEVWPSVFAAFACINHGDAEVRLDDRRLPFGANVAFRMDRQRVLAYDPNRGVRPGSRMGGEEIDVIRRVLTSVGEGWWVPTARVRHYIPPDRQTLEYLRRYFDADGEYIGRYESHTLMDGFPTLLGRPRWLWRVALEAELRYRLTRWFRDPTEWMGDLITASTSWGKLRGFAHRRGEGE